MLTRLTELIETHNLFVRERRETELNWLRSLGIVLVYFGLSFRQVAKELSFSDETSHEAVMEWYHRANDGSYSASHQKNTGRR